MANGFGVGGVKKEKHWNDKNNTPITPQQEANLKKAQGANPTKYVEVIVPQKPPPKTPQEIQREKDLEILRQADKKQMDDILKGIDGQ